jgi:DNA-binding transcriptional LysR family regulator
METIYKAHILQYLSFWAVAQKGSFSKAASTLLLTKSQISKRVSDLESMLNARLFHRTTRAVSLTSEGLELLPRVEKLVESLQGLEKSELHKKKLSGVIRIATLHSFLHSYLAQILVEFTKLHPEVTFDLIVGDRVVDMIEERVDLAFRVQEPKGADFVFRKIVPNRMVFCASPGYLKQLKKIPKSLRDLEQLPILSLKVFNDLRLVPGTRTLGSLDSPRKITCDTGHAVTTLALAGAGIAVRSMWDVENYFQSGELKAVCPHIKIEDFRALYCVTPHSRFLPERTQVFIEFFQNRLKTNTRRNSL